MKKTVQEKSYWVSTRGFPTIAVILGWLAAASALSTCGSETGQASSEAGTPGESGQVGALGTYTSEQDSPPMVVRRVWGGRDVNLSGDISPDGGHLTFIDGEGNLAVRDLGTGEVRLLTHDATWYDSWQVAEGAAISSDGEQVAYVWYLDSDVEYELRVVDWEGGEPRVVLRDGSLLWFGIEAWSPDGQQILIYAVGPDQTGQLSLVSTVDGSVRTVKELGFLWPGSVDFSPDGRWVVYDLPEGENSNERDIYVVSVDGGQEVRVVQHPANDFVLGWAPDGDHVLFASDRAGSLGAWLLPLADGQSAGDPRLVKPDLWRVDPIGFTADGSYCYGVSLDQTDVYVAAIDPESGAVMSPPTTIDGEDLGAYFRPQWSPDGRYLSFSYQEASVNAWYTDRYYIGIRSVETGETRRLVLPELRVFGNPRWFPDGHHLLVSGPMDHREGVFKVDVQTGGTEPLEPFWDMDIASFLGFSPDGRVLFYRKRESNGTVTAQMDLERGVETILFTAPVNRSSLSPDGRYLAYGLEEESGFRIVTMPAEGGELRDLLSFEADQMPSGLWSMTWSPDGRHLYYMALYENAPHQLWRLPVIGGPPQKILEVDPGLNIPVNLSFHPDGRRIAFDAQRSGAEVWLMEDFLPGKAHAEGIR